MKIKANDMHNFDVRQIGTSLWRVTYTSDGGRICKTAIINDAPLMDATINSDHARARDIERLRREVVACGRSVTGKGRDDAVRATRIRAAWR